MFHWTQGIYFGRTSNGSVRLIQRSAGGFPEADGPAPTEGSSLDVTIPAAEWASIVSTVTKSGEATNYVKAVALHGE